MKGPSHSRGRRRWGWLLPLLVGTAFIAEIAFLGRLDMAKNAEVVESWTTSFYRRPSAWSKAVEGEDGDRDIRRCEERLESEGAVPYDRDFDKDPVLVGAQPRGLKRRTGKGLRTPDLLETGGPKSSAEAYF